MFQGKSNNLKTYPKKSTLDHVLWFVENYLPNKKNLATRTELNLDTFEAKTINQIKKLASLRSKSITPEQTNMKVSFTLGKWALPYLKPFEANKISEEVNVKEIKVIPTPSSLKVINQINSKKK